jgi:hypothetical protein
VISEFWKSGCRALFCMSIYNLRMILIALPIVRDLMISDPGETIWMLSNDEIFDSSPFFEHIGRTHLNTRTQLYSHLYG